MNTYRKELTYTSALYFLDLSAFNSEDENIPF